MKLLILGLVAFFALSVFADQGYYPGPTNPVPGQPGPGSPVPGQPYPGQPYPGQPNPVPAPAPAPMPAAEIQIFYGYVAYDTYASKVVSTQVRPLSIGYIMAGWQTAACYKGDPNSALYLFNQMVSMYNVEQNRAITVAGENFYFYADGKGALQIDTRDEQGAPFLQFPRMIECDRWSTPAERGY